MDSSTVDAISLDIKQVRNLRSPGQTFDQALLAWDAPLDTTYLLDYAITGPGLEPFQTRGLEYTATGLIPDVPYLFHVQARRSQGSPAVPVSISVVTRDRVPPTRPQELKIKATTPSNAMLTWSASKDNVGVVGYEVRRNGGAWILCLVTEYPVANLQLDEKFEVRAVDGSDNRSLMASVVNSKPTAPTKPSNFRVTNDAGSSVTLQWDSANADYFDLYCNGSWNQTITENVAVVADLNEGVTYTFIVRAADFAGNQVESAPLLVTTKDITPPSRPTHFRATSVTDDSAFLEWDESIDNVGVIGYQIFRNGTPGPTIDETSYLAADLAQGTTYTFIVRAMDAAGNHADSDPLPITLKDTIDPSRPTNFRATSIIGDSAYLQWDGSTDNVGITGYQIFRDATPITTVISKSYIASGLAQDVTYTFKVRALDAAGNFADSESLLVSTDLTRPSKPTNLRVTALTNNSAFLEWVAATDNVGVTGYQIFRDTTPITTVTSTRYNATGLVEGRSYVFKVRALDAGGNYADSDPLLVSVDLTAPSKPTNLRTLSITNNSVLLEWVESTDNIGIAGYQIFRDTTPITTVTSTRYNVTGLVEGSSYVFKVRALDAAGNFADSDPLTVYMDASPPSKPTKLYATHFGGKTYMSWEASTDNIRVTYYEVYRNNSPLGTVDHVPGRAHAFMTEDVVLPWTIKVRAYDAAGNYADSDPVTSP